jgi:hypothetical protein
MPAIQPKGPLGNPDLNSFSTKLSCDLWARGPQNYTKGARAMAHWFIGQSGTAISRCKYLVLSILNNRLDPVIIET